MDVLNERGMVDITKFKPVTRLGDITFGRIGDVFKLPTPIWAKESNTIRQALRTTMPSKL